jgi:hypothetical protein
MTTISRPARGFRAAARVLALAALLAVPGGRAHADSACLADAERLCPGIPAAGDGRLWACLQRNNLQLSSRCVENVQAVQRIAQEFAADCAADIHRLCPRTPRGGGQVLECLRPYLGRRELGSNCEEAVVKAFERWSEFADACQGDAAALCPDVQAGGGRMLLCLRAQSDRLSSRCRKVVGP